MALSDVITQLDDLIGTETDQRIWKALELVRSALATIAETTSTELTTVDNTVPRFDGTEGALQTSGVTIDNSDNVTGVVGLTATGTVGANAVTSTTTLSVGTTTSLGGGVTFTKTAASVGLAQTAEDTASTNGEDMPVVAQSAGGVTSTGGSAYLQGGTGTDANGSAQLRDSAGNIVVEAGPADNTLGFYALATPIAKQTVTGLTVDEGTINLFAALEALGLIVDGHTEV